MSRSADRLRKERGRAAEQAAEAYLRQRGLELVERNFSCRFGELDLIMREGLTLVFVEVRYRRGPACGGAAASVGPRKRSRLLHAAQGFLTARPQYEQWPCRFDVVALSGDPRRPTLEWIPDAFQA